MRKPSWLGCSVFSVVFVVGCGSDVSAPTQGDTTGTTGVGTDGSVASGTTGGPGGGATAGGATDTTSASTTSGVGGATGGDGTAAADGVSGSTGAVGGNTGTDGNAGDGSTAAGGDSGAASSVGTDGAADSGSAGGATACESSPGAAFSPLTSYAERDGGFGPADVTRNTGDDGLGSDRVAIFRPAADKYGLGGVRHPLIVWGNGHTNTVDIWQGFLSRVATYGFVVVAPEQTEVTAEHMNQAIDYVLGLANDPASGDCGRIDTTKLGSTGYSRGGMGAISVSSDTRITSTFIFASGGNVSNFHAPWGVIGGDMDTVFDWSSISSAVTGSTQPAFGAALAGIDHNRVAGNGKAQEAYIAWMRWRFMGDQAGHDMFVGPNCQICSDSDFSAVLKTETFDSL